MQQLAHIVLERTGTVLGQISIVFIRRFGRSKAMYADTCYRRILIFLDQIDGLNNLVEFTRILPIVRIKRNLIYREIDGVECEPFEEVQVDTPDEYTGSVIDSLNKRKGEMQNMEQTDNGQTRLIYLVPSRGLIGYSTEFMSLTRGYGIMNHTFEKYAPVIKNWNPGRQKGTLVSMNAGKATTYAMMGIESRGTLLIDPGTEVYEGMIVGENSRENDITVNITKGKNLTNVRAAGSDEMARIKTPTHLSLEESLEFLNDDEYCEITPENVRLRKQILNTNAREKAAKRKKQAQSK